MRTPTITPQRRTPARISGLALATTAVLALTACGGGGSSKPKPTAGGVTAPAPSAPSSAAQFDPAAGPVQDPATLPKTCNGLVTDADIQLNLGQPLAGGDFFSVYQPLPAINQTKRVKCEYGIVQKTDGTVGSSQLDIQVATYSDAKSAADRAASTVGQFAAKQAKYEQVTVGGHPATYVTESTDEVLVMYDGNRTFLVTIQAALASGDQARKLALALGLALYKHVTPTTPDGGASMPGSASPSGPPAGSAPGGTPGAQGSASASAGAPGTPSGGPSS